MQSFTTDLGKLVSSCLVIGAHAMKYNSWTSKSSLMSSIILLVIFQFEVVRCYNNSCSLLRPKLWVSYTK